jgi:hypothetical protein
MAAVTPTSTQVVSLGNKIAIIGTFSAISDTDVWTPGLRTVDGCWLTNGANDVDTGATYSGVTVVFQCAGAMANVKAMVVGT